MEGIYNYISETNHISKIIVLQIFYSHSLWYSTCNVTAHVQCFVLYITALVTACGTVHVMLLLMFSVLYFTLLLSEAGVQCPKWLFSVVPWFSVFPVYYSGTVWMILRWLQLPLLLLYHFRFLHSTFAVFLLWDLHILESSRFLSWSHSRLMKLRHLLAYGFLLHYHWLCSPVYCYRWFCWFALVDSITCLHHLHSFLLIFVHHTSVHSLLLLLLLLLCV